MVHNIFTKKFALFLSIVVGFFYLTTAVHAQLGLFYNVELQVDQPFIKPNQEVTLSLESFSINLNSSNIQWFVDGDPVEEGVGERTFSLTTSGVGSNTQVRALVETTNGVLVEASYLLTPAAVTLVWEAEAPRTTPVFYKGKALVTPGSQVRVIALPQIYRDNSRVRSSDLLYTWYTDNQIVGKPLQRGNNVVFVETDVREASTEVTVVVMTPDQTIEVEEHLSVPLSQPEVYVYQVDSLLGTLFNRALLNTTTFPSSEVTLSAQPFFFSSNDGLEYEWFINNEQTDITGSGITLSADQDDGSSEIRLEVEHKDSVLETARRTFTVLFGNQQSFTP